MKKLIYLFLTVLIVACSSDDGGSSNCPSEDAIALQYDNATTTYVSNPNRANCEAWVVSMELILQCTELSALERTALEQYIESAQCSQFPN